jgi:hypothetical protein
MGKRQQDCILLPLNPAAEHAPVVVERLAALARTLAGSGPVALLDVEGGSAPEGLIGDALIEFGYEKDMDW